MNNIFVCKNPTANHWQLGHSFETLSNPPVLIGWQTINPTNDAGVPDSVSDILIGAMTSVARVTFPTSSIKSSTSEKWTKLGEDFVLNLTDNKSLKKLWNIVSGLPTEINLLSTRQSATAKKLFEDPQFPWWMQGQIAFLSSLEKQPPTIVKENFLAVFENVLSQYEIFFQESNIDGIIKPGVDGDLIGFFYADNDFRENFLNTLESIAESNDFQFKVTDEKEFSGHLAEDI